MQTDLLSWLMYILLLDYVDFCNNIASNVNYINKINTAVYLVH